MMLPGEILSRFKALGEKKAITSVDVDTNTNYSISYKELHDAIKRGATSFEKWGLKKGDTISYRFENAPEVLVLNLICLLFGYRACPLDSKRDTPEVAAQKMKETETKLFFYRKDAEEILKLYKPKAAFKVGNFEELMGVINSHGERIPQQVRDDRVGAQDDIVLILYTSGTTGFPKGAELSYANLFYGSYQVGEWFKISPDDVFYIVLPLHHINSTIFSLATLIRGGSLVLPSRYSKSHFWEHLAHYHVTMSSIVPTINIDLLEEEDAFLKVKNKLQVKYIQIGSAPVSAKHTTEFVKKYGIRLVQGYGSTETALRVTGVPVDAPDDLYMQFLSENSIGVPLVCNEVILDGAVSENEESEICVKGKNIMRGYLDRADETEKALSGGMFHTGDMGYYKIIAGTKYYFLKGRIKEIIIKGGVNISPLFIEEKLREELPWVRDVVVVGFPHYRFGEEVGAILIPKEEGMDPRDFVPQSGTQPEDDKIKLEKFVVRVQSEGLKNLSSYETPQAFVIATDSEIAKTATGKVQHIQVREAFKEKLVHAYKNLGASTSFEFNIITPDDDELLKQAVPLHNRAFPFAAVDENSILDRVRNGFVIGAFDHSQQLVGVLTGFFCSEKLLKKGKDWEEITGSGTFKTGSAKGEVAVLVSAASVQAKEEKISEMINSHLSLHVVEKYISTDKDFVVRFHHAKKAGFKTGAHLYRIIEKGNIRDKASLGYVVLFEYPPLSTLVRHDFTKDSIGIGLVEAAIKHAWLKKKEKVVPLSRLGEGWKNLGKG